MQRTEQAYAELWYIFFQSVVVIHVVNRINLCKCIFLLYREHFLCTENFNSIELSTNLEVFLIGLHTVGLVCVTEDHLIFTAGRWLSECEHRPESAFQSGTRNGPVGEDCLYTTSSQGRPSTCHCLLVIQLSLAVPAVTVL